MHPQNSRFKLIYANYFIVLGTKLSQNHSDVHTRPIAWVHIAFTGKYRFKKNNGAIDIEAMVEALVKHLKQHFCKVN
jgi:hypothetical protein